MSLSILGAPPQYCLFEERTIFTLGTHFSNRKAPVPTGFWAKSAPCFRTAAGLTMLAGNIARFARNGAKGVFRRMTTR